MLVFNSNTKVQLSVTQTRRYRLSKFGQNETDKQTDRSTDRKIDITVKMYE